ncbi:MAG: hypothetical protein ABIK99_06480 [candidate division WOR-3 bacterium]
MIEVKRVETKKELREFILLPFKLYKGDKNWVPPLISEMAETLDVKKNPFFSHAERELFLAKKGGQVVGRVASIIDYNYNDYHQKKVGYFGFFEAFADYEIAAALFDQVREDLKKKGMEKMVGPANPGLYDECGFLLEGFDSPPVLKMSYNPPYYLEFCERYGMRKEKDFYAYAIRTDQEVPEKLKRVLNYLKEKKNIRVRRIDLKRLDKEIYLIKEIYNDAWSENWDFAPLTDAEFKYLGRKLKPIAVSELLPIVEVDGEAAGVSLALPDYNQVLKRLNGRLFPFGFLKFLIYKKRIDAARLWALGVKKKFHNLGLDALLYYETFEGAKRLGYKWGEVSQILEDNLAIIRPIEMWGCKLYKKTRIYGIEI